MSSTTKKTPIDNESQEYFDSLEHRAELNRGGFLYQAGTFIFPILGNIAEKSLALIGQEKYVEKAYLNTTISVEEFQDLKSQGKAVAPKSVVETIFTKNEFHFSETLN